MINKRSVVHPTKKKHRYPFSPSRISWHSTPRLMGEKRGQRGRKPCSQTPAPSPSSSSLETSSWDSNSSLSWQLALAKQPWGETLLLRGSLILPPHRDLPVGTTQVWHWLSTWLTNWWKEGVCVHVLHPISCHRQTRGQVGWSSQKGRDVLQGKGWI